jgi:mono/diheme cytochrome c family protein
MVRRLLATLSMVVLVAALALAAGCVDSSEEAAQTPSNASTVQNSAIQTDSAGETVTAPGATPPAGGGGTTAPEGGGTTAPEGGGGGDAAAGQQVFASTCTSCHLNNGMDAGGVGPQLAGAGLDETTIAQTIENGRPGTAMPAGLVSGDDLENVAAYVLSLQ